MTPPAVPSRLDQGWYGDRAAKEIIPEKSESQHQPAQCSLPDRADPRGVIELADLDQESES